MRIMAVDYGEARTGVAVSDELQTIAGDAWVIYSKKMQETAAIIAREAAMRNVSCIVVGYPKNMDGTIGESAKKSERLCMLLGVLCREASSREIEIRLWDERLTTMSANRILTDAGVYKGKRKKTVDAVAAALILESYLDSPR